MSPHGAGIFRLCLGLGLECLIRLEKPKEARQATIHDLTSTITRGKYLATHRQAQQQILTPWLSPESQKSGAIDLDHSGHFELNNRHITGQP